MHLQVLSSGSRGNATLVRADDATLLIDAGLGMREMEARFEAARVSIQSVDHVAVTHGHLDHARNAGVVARRAKATLHCCERLQQNPTIRKARSINTLSPGRELELPDRQGKAGLSLTGVLIPHDAVPTVAFRVEHQRGDVRRRAVVLTDMGRPDAAAARALAGAHVLVLEFNHDRDMLDRGPYPASLRRRVAGDGGHLSNAQAAEMLRALAGPELHTLVLAHLSEKNNTPELAVAAARAALEELGRTDVEVLVAAQDEVGPNLEV